MEFDSAIKPVPVVTEEVTQTIEELIRTRIREGLWDDRVAGGGLALAAAVQVGKAVSTLRPERGLADQYADEYKRQAAQARQREAAQDAPMPQLSAEKLAAETDEEKAVRAMFRDLCAQLDSFTNTSYIAPPAMAGDGDAEDDGGVTVLADANGKKSISALSVEEASLTRATGASRRAPEEVYMPGGNARNQRRKRKRAADAVAGKGDGVEGRGRQRKTGGRSAEHTNFASSAQVFKSMQQARE